MEVHYCFSFVVFYPYLLLSLYEEILQTLSF